MNEQAHKIMLEKEKLLHSFRSKLVFIICSLYVQGKHCLKTDNGTVNAEKE
jgi:hypothetical protein